MKRLILTVLASLFFLSGNVWADSAIIKFDTGINATNHWYQRIDQSLNWDQAQAYATSLGGYLATILSEEENNFIFGNLNDGTNYWLGGNDVDNEGTWVWENGDGTFWDNGPTSLYANFAPREPNGSGDYLQYWPTNTGYWDDTNIAHHRGGNEFIVEYNAYPTPEPATMLLLGTGLVGLAGASRRKVFKK